MWTLSLYSLLNNDFFRNKCFSLTICCNLTKYWIHLNSLQYHFFLMLSCMLWCRGSNLKILEPCSENVFVKPDVVWLRKGLKITKKMKYDWKKIISELIKICFDIEIQKMRWFSNKFENFFRRIWQDLDRCRKWIIYRPPVKDIWII